MERKIYRKICAVKAQAAWTKIDVLPSPGQKKPGMVPDSAKERGENAKRECFETLPRERS